MEEVIAWIITGIFTFVLGCVCGRSSHRRTSDRTGSDLDTVRDSIERAGDDNQRLADGLQRTGDDNQRAQQLVERAREILANAKHTDSDN